MAWKFNPFTGKLDYYESGTGGAVPEAPIDGVKYARKDAGWVTFSEAGAPAWGSITGTLSAQTDLQTALNGKASTSHTHAIVDVTGLQTALDGKASTLGADDNYVTDAEKVKLSNLSGTNSGDNAVNTLYSGLATSKVDANVAITGATKTKITYDAKGLVTAGADATTADIADSLNKRYVTDAQQTVISNTSGTNTGDNAVNSNYSGLVTNQTHTGDATGSTALTVVRINGTSLAGLATGLLKNTTGTGVPSIAVNTDLPVMSATVGGAVPTPPNNTTTFLRGDGTFATPTGGSTNLSYTAATRVLASDTGTDATLPLVSSGDAGLAPASGGGTTNFLRADGTWTAPTASATITTQDEGGTLSSTVTTLNFVGAGVTASGAGATTTITINGGAGGGVTLGQVTATAMGYNMV